MGYIEVPKSSTDKIFRVKWRPYSSRISRIRSDMISESESGFSDGEAQNNLKCRVAWSTWYSEELTPRFEEGK